MNDRVVYNFRMTQCPALIYNEKRSSGGCYKTNKNLLIFNINTENSIKTDDAGALTLINTVLHIAFQLLFNFKFQFRTKRCFSFIMHIGLYVPSLRKCKSDVRHKISAALPTRLPDTGASRTLRRTDVSGGTDRRAHRRQRPSSRGALTDAGMVSGVRPQHCHHRCGQQIHFLYLQCEECS